MISSRAEVSFYSSDFTEEFIKGFSFFRLKLLSGVCPVVISSVIDCWSMKLL